MTKKDYELIAKALKQAYDNASTLIVVEKNTSKKSHDLRLRGIAFTVLTLTIHLERENDRFDRKRFLQACGFVEREPDVLVPLDEVSAEAAATARAYRRSTADKMGASLAETRKKVGR